MRKTLFERMTDLAREGGYRHPPRRLQVSRHAGFVGINTSLPTDRPKVNVMRPGPWGNPFMIGRDGARGECVSNFESWLKTQYELVNERHMLRGRDLLCCCGPHEACHGDVWLRVANMTRDELFDWMLS